MSFHWPGSCQTAGAVLLSITAWNVPILDVAEMLPTLLFLFTSLSCVQLCVGMFSPWILDLPAITVANIALLSAWLPFVSYITLAHILSHALATIFSAEQSQGWNVPNQTFSHKQSLIQCLHECVQNKLKWGGKKQAQRQQHGCNT